MYAIITENDISQWDDKTGSIYHFPNRYKSILQPGTKVIYYKGKQTDKAFENKRLTKYNHYFGIAEIGKLTRQNNSSNFFAEIKDFLMFEKAVLANPNGITYEEIPETRKSNYWRDGVRLITKEVYDKILNQASFLDSNRESEYNDNETEDEALTSGESEGGIINVFTTKYERNPNLRSKAIRIHGYSCMACEFNFKERYGVWGEGYIHVHHLYPISLNKEEKVFVDPLKDLIVLCANCHSMIHRRKKRTLSLSELKQLIQ